MNAECSVATNVLFVCSLEVTRPNTDSRIIAIDKPNRTKSIIVFFRHTDRTLLAVSRDTFRFFFSFFRLFEIKLIRYVRSLRFIGNVSFSGAVPRPSSLSSFLNSRRGLRADPVAENSKMPCRNNRHHSLCTSTVNENA